MGRLRAGFSRGAGGIEHQGGDRRPTWFRRHAWAIVVSTIAFFVGLGIGASDSSSGTTAGTVIRTTTIAGECRTPTTTGPVHPPRRCPENLSSNSRRASTTPTMDLVHDHHQNL